MDQDQLCRTFELHGHSARVRKDEIEVQTCVFCSNPNWNLEVNLQRGVYHCWDCRNSGTVSQLLQDLFGIEEDIEVTWSADSPTRSPPPKIKESVRVSKVHSAVHYLKKRGFTEAWMSQYGLQVCVEESHRLYARILFPVEEYWTRKWIGFIARDYIGESPRYLNDFLEREIVGYRQRDSEVHILCEGPVDGIMLHQAGFNAAFQMGIPGKGVEEWAAQVPLDGVIVIALDGAAKEQANKLRWRIAPIKKEVSVLDLPSHLDPGSLLPGTLRQAVHTVLAKGD